MTKAFLILFLLFSISVSGQQTLPDKIDQLIKTLPQGSEVGIAIYDLTTKKPIYNYRADKLSRPASTMKLATGIATLNATNTSLPFTTEVWQQGIVSNDTLYGDLYVVGGFDPEFDDEAMNRLVNQLASTPIRVIEGNIYGDVSMKDSLYWGSGWAWDDSPSSYQPYLSPLMFSKGTVTVSASTIGDSIVINTIPASTYYTVENYAVAKQKEAGPLKIDRDWLNHSNTIYIRGNVDRGASRELNIVSSQDFFMHTFVERLAARGISLDSVYQFKELIKDSLSQCVAQHHTPFQKVLDKVMKDSDNLNAEALLYRLGAAVSGNKHVSSADGLKAITALLGKLGYKEEQYKIADGSGLSNYNYLTPAILVNLLKFAYADTQLFQQLYKALPISGIDGTLKNRMKQTAAYRKVNAKTGSFTAINCLAGYAKAANGHDIAFAIMNQNILKAAKAREFQNRVCEAICEGK